MWLQLEFAMCCPLSAVRNAFQPALAKLQEEGWLTVNGESIDTTREGLLQIDRHLPIFFDPQYVSSRYT